MMRKMLFIVLAVALSAGHYCFAQGDNASIEERISRLENKEGAIDVHFFLRTRANASSNLDLDSDVKGDNSQDYFDTRSYLTTRLTHNPFSGVIVLDIAGDEFNDGALFGNDDPSRLRILDVSTQQLYFQYNGPLSVSIGRQPAQLGHGIVAHINRDSIKVGKMFKKLGMGATAVYIKGSEIDSASSSSLTSQRGDNASNGDDNDLDAYGLIARKKVHDMDFMAYVIQLVDSNEDKHLPEKGYFGITTDGTPVKNTTLKGELNFLFGRTPGHNTLQGTAVGERADYHAYMLYLDGTYSLGKATAGVGFGIGSGDNDATDKKAKNFESLFYNETGYTYNYIYSDDIHGYDGTGATLARGAGFANTTFVQLHGAFTPVEHLTIGGSYTYLMATKDQLEGTGVLGTGTASSASKTDNIGQEVDVNASYMVSKNVTVSAAAGYFLPGDIFGSSADNAFKSELAVVFSL